MTLRYLSYTALLAVMLAMSALILPAAAAASTAGHAGSALAETAGSEESAGPSSVRRTTTRELTNPLGSTDIASVVGRAIQIFTGVSGSIALLMFVYGGVMWLTSGGSPDKVQKGKKIFVWATIGLAVIFGGYAILDAVFTAIGAK